MRDFYSKILASKPKEWEYEKEVRMIFHTRDNDKSGKRFIYNKSAIQTIMIGEKMSDEDQNKILCMMKNADLKIPIKKAKCDRFSYKVTLQDLN